VSGPETGDLMRFRVDSWGHSNFDDARLPSMRIAARKGICGLFQVDATESANLLWRFRLEQEWLPERLDAEMDPMAAILPPNAWNSTRMPLIASYSIQWTLREGSDACALEMSAPEAETAVYVDGIPAGAINAFDPWMDLTGWFRPGQTRRISLLCRKRHWAEPAGTPVLYHLRKLVPDISGCSELDLARHDFSALPQETNGLWTEGASCGSIAMTAGETWIYRFPLDGIKPACRNLRIKGHAVKVTGLFNGHLLGRVFCPGDSRPAIVGGDPELLYLPGPWFPDSDKTGSGLTLIVEALGAEAILESVCLEL